MKIDESPACAGPRRPRGPTWLLLAASAASMACIDLEGVGPGAMNGDLNPDVPGRFLFLDDDRAFTMDISTGEYVQIPNTDWRSQTDRFEYARGIADFVVSPRNDGSTFLLTVESCGGGPLYQDSCVAVQGYDGSYQSMLVIDGDADSRAKSSPTDEYFVMFRDLADDWLEIWDMDGNLVSDIPKDSSDVEWLPDGRLVYPTAPRVLSITEPYDAAPAVSWTLPDSFPDGGIASIAVAPDGHRLAFTYRTAGTLVSEDAQFFVIDLDDGAIRRVATTPGGPDDDAFHHFAWSPDGEWLAVLEGGVTGNSAYNPGVAASMYLVPANAEDEVFVVTPYDDGQLSADVIKLERYLDVDDPSDPRTTFGFDDWLFDWLPE